MTTGDPPTTLRPCWANCALSPDAEILAIDRMEDELAGVPEGARRVRSLISTFELCHHDAAHRMNNILDAIEALDTAKGHGTRPASREHPAERSWRDAMIRVRQRAATVDPLRRWQLERVAEKIHSVLDPAQPYTWLLLCDDGGTRATCPDAYVREEEYWLATITTMIHDPAELSLALAIDMLWPCHWNFEVNLQIVLDAIDGDLHPTTHFTACGRHIEMTPLRTHVERTCASLRDVGEPDSVRRWLAASFDKTLRLHLDPPDDARAIAALRTPGWIRNGRGDGPDSGPYVDAAP